MYVQSTHTSRVCVWCSAKRQSSLQMWLCLGAWFAVSELTTLILRLCWPFLPENGGLGHLSVCRAYIWSYFWPILLVFVGWLGCLLPICHLSAFAALAVPPQQPAPPSARAAIIPATTLSCNRLGALWQHRRLHTRLI